ncbi:hypothetical protein [Priestia aryabhattai]|uniref:hypothetical protein n=1 Tax=Priestia aryabhattai TaxID=412384 RepID=UPI000BF2365A|nr:hypothetical protein [Priestia aryabhattai]PEI52099.1 hypothetical protein CN635_23445 [Priestia aryabhattai]
MIGLILSILVFNVLAFKTNKRFTANQIVHIWMFTIAAQHIFDVFINFKFHGYWYFTQETDWQGIFAYTVLIPPVNMLFLTYYPLAGKLTKKAAYILFWSVAVLLYEVVALLPAPWGYFHYGWWTWWYSLLLNPLLFWMVVQYYRWVCKLERNSKII